MMRWLFVLTLALGMSGSAMAVIVPMTLTFDAPSTANDTNILHLRIDASYTLIWKDSDYDTDTAQVLSGSTANLNVGYTFDPTTRAITSISSIEFTGGRYSLQNTDFDMTLQGVGVEIDGRNIAGTLDTVSPPGSITTYSSGSATFPMPQHKTKINEGTIAIDAGWLYSSTTNLATDPINAIFTSGAGTITTSLTSVVSNVATYSVGINLPVVFGQDIDTGSSSATAKVSGSGTFIAHGTFTKAIPVAVNDTYSTNEDTVLSVAAKGVLTNDTDADSTSLTSAIKTNPAHGTVTLNSNGSFTYTPTGNYNGPDTFTYYASDSLFYSNTATVNLTVASVNDLPVAVSDAYGGSEDAPLTIAAKGVLTNDTDVESNPLTALKITNPAHGSVALNSDGSFTYTPSANYHGADSFAYKANDGYGDSTAAATVNLTVASVNDVPVAVGDGYSATEDVPLTVYASSGVLKNDVDADNSDEDTENNDVLNAVLVSSASGGTLTLGANGWLTYTPSPNWHGADSFTYKVNDGTANSNVATVNMDVVPVNDAPIAVDDSYICVADATNTIYSSLGVLKNDTDPDNTDNDTTHQDTLTASLQTSTAHGSIALGEAGWFTYTPITGYRGADSFTYKVFDGTVYSGLATVLLDVFGPAVILPGDANGDGHVNQLDAAVVAQYWGQSVSGAVHGDFNGDGVVNAADASIMAANWGYSAAEASQVAVPEPSLLALLGGLLAGATARRRRTVCRFSCCTCMSRCTSAVRAAPIRGRRRDQNRVTGATAS